MPDPERPPILPYESPVDAARRMREQGPHGGLGVASCIICFISVNLTVGWVVLERARNTTTLGIFAILSFACCLMAGVPLAWAGLPDNGPRNPFAVIGLWANIVWVLVFLFGLQVFLRN